MANFYYFKNTVNKKQLSLCALIVFLMSCFINSEVRLINVLSSKNTIKYYEECFDKFRDNPVEYINSTNKKKSMYYSYYKSIVEDIEIFPINVNYLNKVEYSDTWGFERNFGGNRTHEGTDIMSVDNIRGVIPVVSMTDGVIINIGWLKLGGYRVGILSDNNVYYYYAHLSSYAPMIAEGDRICAGEFIGFMGDTGYSEVEGTCGNFPVHLHVGIYIYDSNNNEYSVNPYAFLKKVEN